MLAFLLICCELQAMPLYKIESVCRPSAKPPFRIKARRGETVGASDDKCWPSASRRGCPYWHGRHEALAGPQLKLKDMPTHHTQHKGV